MGGALTTPPLDSYVKFGVTLTRALPEALPNFEELKRWRRRFFDLGLIGMYPNGVGFGNLSLRVGQGNQFLVTGTATENSPELDLTHCAEVTSYSIDGNSVTATGLVPPSSECMTHAAIYQCDSAVNAVVHIHSLELWQTLRFVAPTTAETATYGTPAIANEVIRLFRDTDVWAEKLLVMGGHEKGIMSFGTTMAEAGQVLLDALAQTRL